MNRKGRKRVGRRKGNKKVKTANQKTKEGLTSEEGLEIESRVNDTADIKKTDVENTEQNIGLQVNDQRFKVNALIALKKEDPIIEENVMLIENHGREDEKLQCDVSETTTDPQTVQEKVVMQEKTLETTKEETQNVSQSQKYFKNIICYGAFGCGLDIFVHEIRADEIDKGLSHGDSENTVNEPKSPKRKCKEAYDEDIQELKRKKCMNQFQNEVNIVDYANEINSHPTNIINTSMNTNMKEPYYKAVENGKIVEYSSYEQHCLHIFEELFGWNDAIIDTTPQWFLDEIDEATSEIYVDEVVNKTSCELIDLLVAETLDDFGDETLTDPQGSYDEESCSHKGFGRRVQSPSKNDINEFPCKMEHHESVNLKCLKDEIESPGNVSESMLENSRATITAIQTNEDDVFTNISTVVSRNNSDGSTDGERRCPIEQEFCEDLVLNTDKGKTKTMAEIVELHIEQKDENNFLYSVLGLYLEKNTTQERAFLEETEDSHKTVLKEQCLKQCTTELQNNCGVQDIIQETAESGKINKVPQSDKSLELLKDRKQLASQAEIVQNYLDTVQKRECDEHSTFTFEYQESRGSGHESKENVDHIYSKSVRKQNGAWVGSNAEMHNYHQNKKLNLIIGNANDLPQLKTQLPFLDKKVNDRNLIHSVSSDYQAHNISILHQNTQHSFIDNKVNISSKNAENTSTKDSLKVQNKTLKNYFEEFQDTIHDTDKNEMPMAFDGRKMPSTAIQQEKTDKTRGSFEPLNAQKIVNYNPKVNSSLHRKSQQLFVLPDGRKVPAEEPKVKEYYIDFLKHAPPQIHIPNKNFSVMKPENRFEHLVQSPAGHSQSWDASLRNTSDPRTDDQSIHLMGEGGVGSAAQNSYVEDTLRRIFRKEKEVWVCLLCGKKLCSRASLLRHERTMHWTGEMSTDINVEEPISFQFSPKATTKNSMSTSSLNLAAATPPMSADTLVHTGLGDVFEANQGTTLSSTNTRLTVVQSDSSNTCHILTLTQDETGLLRNKPESMSSQERTMASSSFTGTSQYPMPLAIPHESLVKRRPKPRVPSSPYVRFPSRPSKDVNLPMSQSNPRSQDNTSTSQHRHISTTLENYATPAPLGRPPLPKHITFTSNTQIASSQGFSPWPRNFAPTSSEILRPIMDNSGLRSSNISASSMMVRSDLSLSSLSTVYCSGSPVVGQSLPPSQYAQFRQMLPRHLLGAFSSGSSKMTPRDYLGKTPLSLPVDLVPMREVYKFSCHLCNQKYKFEAHYAKHMIKHGRQIQN